MEIHLPPLRERKEDIPLLLDHFLTIYSKKYNRKGLKIQSSAIKKLINYSWPGNVRELSHMVERAVILAAENCITIEDFTLSKDVKQISITDFNLEIMEKRVIKEAVEAEDGNLSRTASLLGITRATLYRKLEKYGI